ncbi:MAG: lysylphosphatidylglycerol synthase transmembrane domain-containing protein [Solirubrobacteraceae bacterium]
MRPPDDGRDVLGARALAWPMLASALAIVLAAVAALVIAKVTGADAIGRAFADLHAPWIALIAGAELLTYPAYTLAYRSIAQIHGHAPLGLPIVARLVVAGFGPFALGGGFGIDKRALHAINEDERSARVRVMALGSLEWTVLAPIACAVSIALLITRANVMPSLLWPWALAVPAGFAVALWVSTPGRAQWMRRLWGGRLDLLAQALEGIGAIRTMVAEPRRFAGAWLGTAAYWVADILAFYGGLRTFGLEPGAGQVIIAYATGYAATRRSMPLGGAGLTELLMTYALYWVRQPLAPALAAVIAYRAFNLLLVAAPAMIAHRQLEPLLREETNSPGQS